MNAVAPPDADLRADAFSRPSRVIIDPTAWHDQPIPARTWIVPDWLAPGYVTLLYADGGMGKSLLALQLMVACATGTPWIGLDVTRCRSIGLFCEDDPDELHRRLARINDHAGFDFRALGDMRLMSGVADDNALLTVDSRGRTETTPFFAEFTATAIAHEARLIVVDTAADTFLGNENDRGQVRQFLGGVLTKLAQDADAAVLLLAHPSRAGKSKEGDMDGGSTAWSNTARSRWSFARPDDEAGSDARILTRRKSNYAASGDTITVNYNNGVFVAPGAIGQSTAAPVHTDVVFLELLDKLNAIKFNVSHSAQATQYAPRIMAKHPDRRGFSKRDFEAAMHRLLAHGEVKIEEYGRPGDERKRLARAEFMP